ncbi:hypothetical protein [Streptomyces sp. NPDC013187]|uniref:hypothetical protein n=1 Tax=Streptomyces sp. NPDC013187 TaxID=3364865 RepID=UPI00367FECE6
MTNEAPAISPVLKQGANKRNRDAARKAVAVALYNGWTLVGPYNGSDTRSHWKCELKGPKCAVIEKFYSHIRGRKKKDGTVVPSPRHRDCIPSEEREAALAAWREQNGLTEEWAKDHEVL